MHAGTRVIGSLPHTRWCKTYMVCVKYFVIVWLQVPRVGQVQQVLQEPLDYTVCVCFSVYNIHGVIPATKLIQLINNIYYRRSRSVTELSLIHI